MSINTRKKLTFEEYLSYDDGTDNRYELVDGELVELPPESEPNSAIVDYLFLKLVEMGTPFRLIKRHTCEIQVPVLQLGDAQNRFPDLVVLRHEHLALTRKRLTIKLDMPPPQLVVEVVSPGQTNRDRDYKSKREQYQRVGIPEYWIIDPEHQAVTVLKLEVSQYIEIGSFKGSDPIISEAFPQLMLTPAEIFAEAD
jgi:Uma2 family endonuclease